MVASIPTLPMKESQRSPLAGNTGSRKVPAPKLAPTAAPWAAPAPKVLGMALTTSPAVLVLKDISLSICLSAVVAVAPARTLPAFFSAYFTIALLNTHSPGFMVVLVIGSNTNAANMPVNSAIVSATDPGPNPSKVFSKANALICCLAALIARSLICSSE